jgi:hypothetical protein
MKNRILFPALVWFLVLAATATGVFYNAPGAPIEFLTVRGEKTTFQGNGLYQFDPASVAFCSPRRNNLGCNKLVCRLAVFCHRDLLDQTSIFAWTTAVERIALLLLLRLLDVCNNVGLQPTVLSLRGDILPKFGRSPYELAGY